MKKNINQLMIQGRWKEDKLRDIFPQEIINRVLTNLQLGSVNKDPYSLFWIFSQCGRFSIQSAQKVLRNHGFCHVAFHRILEKEIPFKVIFFIWRSFKKEGSLLRNFGLVLEWMKEIVCYYYDQEIVQTYHHLFMLCPSANQLSCEFTKEAENTELFFF